MANNNSHACIQCISFQKVKEHVSGSSLISKLQVKHDLVEEAIQKGNWPQLTNSSTKNEKKESK